MSTLPHVAVLEITQKCNHKCIFCSCPWEYSVPRPSNELTAREWKQVIYFYRTCGVRHITFSGGEPTLREDLCELISFARGLGFTLGVVSNGRVLSDDLLKFFKENEVLTSISVPGIKTFVQHTGVDNIDNVLALFDKCKSIGLSTVANIAVTKKNIGELYENIALPILHGADYILLNRFLPGGRGMHNTEFMLNKQELTTMLDTAEEVLVRAGIKGHVGTELPCCVIDKQKYKNLGVSTKCGAAKEFFVTDPEGYIKVCNHSPQRICKWDEAEFIENNEYWKRFTDCAYLPEMCSGCKDSDICDGGCREAAHVYCGEIDCEDPIFKI